MDKGEITRFGNPILRKKSRPAVRDKEQAGKLLSVMAEVMYKNGGVGLAAPQAGIDERIIIFDAGEGLVEIINPEITSREGVSSSGEGCLSIPGVTVEVKRASSVVVRGLDRNFEPVEYRLEGLPARIVQHEIDHLDGILITDSLSMLKRKVFERKWSKNSK